MKIDKMPVTIYVPAVEYTYAVDGRTRPGKTFSHHLESHESRRKCLEAIDALLPDDATTAYYSPENPNAAVLVATPLGFMGWLDFLVKTALSLLLAAWSIVLPAGGASDS